MGRRVRPLDFEIFQIESVKGIGANAEEVQEFRPFYRSSGGDPTGSACSALTCNTLIHTCGCPVAAQNLADEVVYTPLEAPIDYRAEAEGTTVTATVTATRGETPYVRFGEWVIGACMIGVALASAAAALGRKSARPVASEPVEARA